MKITIFVNSTSEKKLVEEHLQLWVKDNFQDKSFKIEIEEEK